MSKDRIKRRVLREAVDDNVATIRGALPRNLRRGNGFVWLRRSFFILLPLGVVGSSYFATGVARDNETPVTAHAAVLSLPAAKAKATIDPNRTFAKPQPIDPALLSLEVRRIVIDAGHGGENPGTVSSGGMLEKDVALDIGLRLERMLRANKFEVVMTRSGDQNVTLSNRANLANESSGDLFVSIHLNALRNRARRGVETYYLGPTNDPFLREIAAAENRESGYSLSDMRRLLDGLYADVRQDESRAFAESVQQALYDDLRRVNPKLQNRGVKTAPFVVLVATEMPAILAEVSCLSNDEETRLLHTPEYRERIAQALFAGIRSYAGGRHRSDQKGS